jgi:hypothetical protein
MNAVIESKKLSISELNEGEIYVGIIGTPNGEANHIILLPGDHEEANWDDSMEWAKSIGGDLPDRVEQALLFKHLSDQFQKEWYWSNTQHASYESFAWCQGFSNGDQYSFNKINPLRARAVRRSPI